MLLAYSSVSNHDYLIEKNDIKNDNINNRIIMIIPFFWNIWASGRRNNGHRSITTI